ncbi:MAG: tyrosine-protein phosphatase [Rhodospirillaceae bacterium]|jgi:protein-tyrosine phosphatase|nr:tyrosine-protein phosphatase [Rhodospirillaceae bacterium]MBT4042797.1 tyrosine-protein phosphatase [Rhodospirillaceae bacterium]MBT4687263.1 tyrosine-protein phosphatase [Rhodospirillaceae bacterium]MBT5082706.1 tyrosine-protein phosphatase [Rhodospirillaceae bacterium]MBT5524130.1 tyrosine-protein phosphatase [Rhodospirillaceae bacterium]
MQRRIELTGLSNFRDLGGYQTSTGESVKWGTFFRSDTLASLTDADMDKVCALGINAAVDLRYGDERAEEPSRFLGHDQVEVLALGLDERPSVSFLDSFEPSDVTAEMARTYLMENYQNYPFLYAKAYATLIQRLSAGNRMIVHCTAGKDRAGTAAAMVLTALGVPRDTVFEDYLLTNQYWDRGGRERPGMDAETVANIFSAREEYLHAAFASIEDRCGTIEAYLRDVVGLDDAARDALRTACLD